MDYIIIGLCGFLFFIISIIWCKNFAKNYINSKKWEINEEFKQYKDQKDSELQTYKASIDEVIKALKSSNENEQKRLISEFENQKKILDLKLENERKLVNEKVKKYESVELEKKKQEIEKKKSIQEEDFIKFKEQKEKEIQKINSELEDFKAKQKVAAEEVLRQRQLEEQRDFYRVVLDDAAKDDIKILESVRHKLTKNEFLNTIIYVNYISSPVNEMIKRVLNGKKPCGIYKITRSTGEVYIGKSTNVADRWQQHCKSCYHVGTISHSTLHTLMEKDGLDTFTFQLLEEVDKDKLTEREKYWIQFYNSKELGLNMREG